MDTEIIDSAKCPICLEALNLPLSLTCGHTFCFLCIKGVSETHKVSPYKEDDDDPACPICRAPVNTDIVDKATMTNINQSSHSTVSDGTTVWMYACLNSGWWMYDMLTSSQIESMYQQYANKNSPDEELTNEISIGASSYTIDFEEMSQRHTKNGHARKILRLEKFVQADIKIHKIRGIAGIHFK